MEYTKKELLAKAKRDYPIGTCFISPVMANNRYDMEQVANLLPYFYSGNNIAVCSNWGVVYNNGKWATIISTPESKLTFNYLIL